MGVIKLVRDRYGMLSAALKSRFATLYDFGNALQFDGTDDFASMTALSAGSITISCWVNRVSVAGFSDSVLGVTGDANAYVLHFANEVRIKTSGGASSNFNTTGMLAGVWNHYFITWDSGTTTLKFYLNGVEKTAAVTTQAVGFGSFNEIGSRNGAPFLNANLDDFVVWNGTVGTAQNAVDLYNGGAGVDPTTVIAAPNRWYKLDSVTDSGSDGANLTLNNFVADPYVTH